MHKTRFHWTLSLTLLAAVLLPGQSLMAETPSASVPVAGAAGIERPMGFQEWKQKRIAKARMDLNEFKKPRDTNSLESSQEASTAGGAAAHQGSIGPLKEAELKQQAERLRQLEFNLEIALGLTIHDFFALYLKDKAKLEMAQVVNQLSPEELSELLAAYRDVLYGPPVVESNKAAAIR